MKKNQHAWRISNLSFLACHCVERVMMETTAVAARYCSWHNAAGTTWTPEEAPRQ